MQVLGMAVTFLNSPPGTGFQDTTLIRRRELPDGAGGTDAGRDPVIETGDNVGDPVLNRTTDQTGPYEPDPSIDIV